MKKILLLLVVILVYTSSFCQEIYYNKIFIKNIKTVLMYVEGDDLSMPIWDLGSSKKLILRFDDLDVDTKDYNYKIIHCNSDWTPSDLDESEYIDGYFEDQISDYHSSFNTTVNYTHYSIRIPNEYLRPMISGNYVLQVYESSSPDEIIFNKRFMVVDRKTNIEASIRNMNQTAYFYNDQELEIVVDYFGNEFYDLNQNLKVQVLKNYNWENYLELSQPDLIKDNEFTFNNFSILKFKGANEFHHFNTKNIHYAAENINNISFVDNMYHFQLAASRDRTFEDYQYKPDINGQFKIDVTQSDYPGTEADYSYVYFTLNMDAPMQQGEIYIWAALTNYDFTEENKMRYNFEQKAYEGRLQLKQGYYNYQYVVMENNKPDFTYIEGNHAQTENSYTILVYYHDFRRNYDRLIGVSEVSSK
ncbi:MAG: DUF5103 domain-containing protein [Bacteroidales bacterium]|nr:DUF5103 domain-containing protein [Bacteroidales bacterium]